ncbi:MAG: hypothetical protein WAM14_27300 [Candidatus Nitrosopolaris sp.]
MKYTTDLLQQLCCNKYHVSVILRTEHQIPIKESNGEIHRDKEMDKIGHDAN